MKALSIRQPWAWLILNYAKDIENRDWPTKLRGWFLIHASKGMTRNEYEDACDFIVEAGFDLDDLPPFEDLQRGGIVGRAELVDCVTESESPWFTGKYGFVLRHCEPLPFEPMRGSLGFFEVAAKDRDQ